MTIEAKKIADSVNPDGKRITTLQCKLPRFIWAQVLTHRKFSRNAQSSRACPVEKMIEEVIDDPAMPIHWGKNQRGMQADEECNELINDPYSDGALISKEESWLVARDNAIILAEAFMEAGYHKQIVNRLLEPFMHINVIITATEWDNFFHLRSKEKNEAQPEIQELARVMKEAIDESKPTQLNWGEWHMPYALKWLPKEGINGMEIQEGTSVAACARVSYNNHDGSNRTTEKDIKLHDMLLKDGHMSPFEHQAMAMRGQYFNLNGWCSYRWEIENG